MAEPWTPQKPPPDFAERMVRLSLEEDRARARSKRLIVVLTVLAVAALTGILSTCLVHRAPALPPGSVPTLSPEGTHYRPFCGRGDR